MTLFPKRLLTACAIATIAASVTTMSGCGFHLRGYNAPMQFEVKNVILKLDDDRTSFALKLPLTRQLQSVGVTVVDDIGKKINTANQTNTASINIDNVRFKKFELVGILTEIRVLLSADVTYHLTINGENVVVTNPIQVERSYQYNKASVNVEDQQGSQIRDWLYDNLAQQITDQYIALSLPRVEPTVSTTSQHLPTSAPQ
ncbi:LPS-assembly lipoprotein LptE [Psychrobacter sp. I-STPA10]|uniref:LPS-assembly lipoprotein LptE n=1 Tax=Psychrobacter sp. I-STPA10 TaxID=2585769 RepID=UPI001E3D01AC|nr:hypothetical protein [Psychrobacter sp. I-STPA10]